MKIASVADIKAKLSSYLKASEEELVVITRNGKAVAAIVPVDNDEELERLVLAYSKQFQDVLAQARTEISEGHGITHEAFWNDLVREEPESHDGT
ncbi:MAG: type II toxin-antitoxin system prevent-host-death family antitoxin [Oscillochloris sp.]|nr:type II toxin-antitoxin system prevent-host-death family antitoxin [Oscillochloris sp.]